MPHPLDGCLAKVERGLEHLDALGTEFQAFADGRAFGLVGDFDAPNRRVIFTVRGPHDHPPRFGVLIGDYVHNLRSALDHLVWQLVIANGETPRSGPRGSGFPIFDNHLTRREFRDKAGRGKLRGVHRDAIDLIEGYQPYQRGGAPARFSLMHRLDVADKHQLVHTTNTYFRLGAGDVELDLGDHDPPLEVMGQEFLAEGPIKEGTDVGIVELRDPPPDPQVSMLADVSIDVALQDGTRAIPVLSAMGSDVSGLIVACRPFFETASYVTSPASRSGAPK